MIDKINFQFTDTNSFIDGVRFELAKKIFAAATYLQTQLKVRESTPYPPASVVGQYPHARTFQGRNAVVVYPSDLGTIARTLKTQVGYLSNAFYMGVLEESKGRLGLFSCYQEVKPELVSILHGVGYLKAA